MPRGATQAVLSRTEEVRRLLESEGCLTVERARRALGVSRTQASYVLKRLQREGRAVSVSVGRVSLWCRDGGAAVQALEELAAEVRRLLCGLRFATPRKLLKLVAGDRKASGVFSKYVPLSPTVAAAMSFLNAVLQTVLGPPIMYTGNGTTPVYLVPPCQVLKQ
jgi:hypothetical protein